MEKKIVVGCIVEFEGKILLLKRAEGTVYSGFWGFPAGSVEKNEKFEHAIIREVEEETGFLLTESQLSLVHVGTWKFPHAIINFNTFKVVLDNTFNVILNRREHSDYDWVLPEKCKEINNLVPGIVDILKDVGYYR